MRRTSGDWDFSGASALRIRLHPGETFYGTPEEGQVMYHIGFKGLYVWDGVAWRACSAGAMRLDDLADVDVPAPAEKQFLGFAPGDGVTPGQWTAKAVALSDLVGVNLTGAVEGMGLVLAGGMWVPGSVLLTPVGGAPGQFLARTTGGAGVWVDPPTGGVAETRRRYWRISVTETVGAGERVGVSELRFLRHPAASRAAPTGGTPFSSGYSILLDRTADKAFDNDPATMWMPNPTSPYDPGAALGYDYGAGAAFDIQAVAITIQPDGVWGVANAPKNFDVQFSDDGVTWTTKWAVTGAPWTTVGQTLVFSNPAFAPPALVLADLLDVAISGATAGQTLTLASNGTWTAGTAGTAVLPPGGATGQVLTKLSATDGDATWVDAAGGGGGGASVGAHRYWMLDDAYGDGAVSLAEVRFRATAGGTDILPVSATAKDSYDGGTGPMNTLDGNAGSFWAGGTMPSWIYFDLSSPTAVAEIVLTARNDGWQKQRPARFLVRYSDDGVIWKEVARFIYPFCSISGEVLVVEIPSTR